MSICEGQTNKLVFRHNSGLVSVCHFTYCFPGLIVYLNLFRVDISCKLESLLECRLFMEVLGTHSLPRHFINMSLCSISPSIEEVPDTELRMVLTKVT